MSFIKSILLGSAGHYNVFGVDVKFVPKEEIRGDLAGNNFIVSIAQSCINNRIFQVASLGYLQVFVHEMGHVLAYKLLNTHCDAKVTIYQHCRGMTNAHLHDKPVTRNLSEWKKTIECAAGSWLSIVFSLAKICAAIVLKSYITLPVSVFLATGAFFWIAGELLYMVMSMIDRQGGDFGEISRQHQPIAVAALVSTVALGFFGLSLL